MHQLERETYDDAFLDEALDGYEELADDDHDETFADLKKQLHKRAAKEKQRGLFLWRMLPIAASVLLLLGAGYWFLKPNPIKNQEVQAKQEVHEKLIERKKQIAVNEPPPVSIIIKERKLVADVNIEPKNIEEPQEVLKEVIIENTPSIKYKTDTVEYIASDYKVRSKASADEMLKKAEGFEVSPDGSITFNGTAVSKARLNGKDYSGGDVAQAVKGLPADIVEKFQVVDDYGDQAGRTGIKSGDPNRVLVFTTRGHEKKKTAASGYFMNEPLLYTPQVIFKTDTIEYVTNNYPIPNEAKIISILRNIPAIDINNDEVTSQGRYVKKIKINGRPDNGKDMLAITQTLPADILEKVQIIDDYGDVAGITSIKSGDPEKVINLIVRNIKNRRLPWAFDRRGVIIPGDTVSKPKPVIGWKKYADYIRRNIKPSTNSKKELMVFFYVAPDGTLSNINVMGYAPGVNAINIVKNGPKWLGYTEPRQIWFKVKL